MGVLASQANSKSKQTQLRKRSRMILIGLPSPQTESLNGLWAEDCDAHKLSAYLPTCASYFARYIWNKLF
jgi:hypothetical protein